MYADRSQLEIEGFLQLGDFGSVTLSQSNPPPFRVAVRGEIGGGRNIRCVCCLFLKKKKNKGDIQINKNLIILLK